MTTPQADTPVEELSDRELRGLVKRANKTIREIEQADDREILRSGKADETLAAYGSAIDQVVEATQELAVREQRSIIEHLPFAKQLRDTARKPHPAMRWLDVARRFSAPELQGETLVADRLTEEDAGELEKLVNRKREIATEEHAEPLTEDETSAWETLLGKAAGDEQLFERKRRHAEMNAKREELKDASKVASLPRQPLLAEPGSIQSPRFVFKWLVGREAYDGAFSLADLGLLAALLGAFANEEPSLLVGARFEKQDGDLTLIVPAGIGSQMQFHGKIAGSPIEDGSGLVRGREALAVLVLNKWFEVEASVAELRIRLGEKAKKLTRMTA